MRCYQFREIADSYLGNDLSVETMHAVNSHLANCIECDEELSARRELRTRLRDALINAPENRMRPEFANLLRARLRDYAASNPTASVVAFDSNSFSTKLRQVAPAALAACLLLALGIGAAVWREWNTGRHSLSVSSAANKPDQLPNLYSASLAKSAVGDHRDCAIHFRLSEKPVDLDEAGRKYDPSYTNLANAMLSGGLPEGVEFLEAHSCIFEARRFAHIVFKYQGRLVSFLVTVNQGNTGTSQSLPRDVAQDTVIECSGFEGYHVSCLETASHAIFVVSDLSEAANLALARALAPRAVAHVTQTELKVAESLPVTSVLLFDEFPPMNGLPPGYGPTPLPLVLR